MNDAPLPVNTAIPRRSHFMLVLLAAALSLFFAAPPDWQLMPTPVHASLRGLSVVSSRVVWASGTGGSVLRTSDSGAHWSVSTIPESQSLDFRDVEAFSNRRAVVMSSGSGSKSAVFVTRDGGKRWVRTLSNPDKEGFFDAMAFLTPQHGFLAGDPVDGHFALFETNDGGDRWRRLTGPEALPGESLFAASGTCLAVSRKSEIWIATGGANARLLRSIDAGHSWTSSLVPIRHGKPSAGIFSVAVDAQGRLQAVGGDFTQPNSSGQTAAFSLDRGTTWQTSADPTGYRSSVVYLALSSHSIITVGTNGSDISTDDGRSWQRFSHLALNTVAVEPDGRTVWSVGPDGHIARLGL